MFSKSLRHSLLVARLVLSKSQEENFLKAHLRTQKREISRRGDFFIVFVPRAGPRHEFANSDSPLALLSSKSTSSLRRLLSLTALLASRPRFESSCITVNNKTRHEAAFCYSCAQGGTRTRTHFNAKDFKSFMSTIPSPGHFYWESSTSKFLSSQKFLADRNSLVLITIKT